MNKIWALLIVLTCYAQTARGQQLTTLDIVKVNASYEKEALYFYQENWKAFRELALQKGVISGYEMHRTATDSTQHFQLILITRYPDSTALANSEENFRPIMKEVSPQGPRMLNHVDRKEFLEYVSGYETHVLWESTKKARSNKAKHQHE